MLSIYKLFKVLVKALAVNLKYKLKNNKIGSHLQVLEK